MTLDIDTAEMACEEGNYEEAFKIYQKLSMDENPEAFNGLGYLYENGLGVIQNKKYALSLYKKGEDILLKKIKKNDLKASYKLGDWYYRGVGLKANKKKGLNLIKKAADKGELNSIFFLYQFYSNEIFIEDYKEIFIKENLININFNKSKEGHKWLNLSAEKCHPVGMYNLGQSYRNGLVVEVDYKLSLKWLSLSHIKFKQNDDEFMLSLALDYIRLVKSFLKPNQILEAQNLVNIFVKENEEKMNEPFKPIFVEF